MKGRESGEGSAACCGDIIEMLDWEHCLTVAGHIISNLEVSHEWISISEQRIIVLSEREDRNARRPKIFLRPRVGRPPTIPFVSSLYSDM